MKWLSIIVSGLVWGLIAFVAGAFVGGQLVEPGSGLAGGATVFVCGLGAGFIGLAAGFLLQTHGRPSLRKGGLILGIILIIPVVLFFTWRLIATDRVDEPPMLPVKAETTSSVGAAETSRMVRDTVFRQPRRSARLPEIVGLGFTHLPILYRRQVFYFYASPDQPESYDSLVINGEQLLYAPPYLLPFYQKLDYGQLTFRWLATSHQRFQIELNGTERRSAWVERSAVSALYWPDFMLSLFSIKALDGQENPLRIKPLDHASAVNDLPMSTYFLQPVQVTDEWVELAVTDDAGRPTTKTGWLRWRRGKALLVSWDYRL